MEGVFRWTESALNVEGCGLLGQTFLRRLIHFLYLFTGQKILP